MTYSFTGDDSDSPYLAARTYRSDIHELERFQAECGRLEWILGLADEAPEQSITALFKPMTYCLERMEDSNLVSAVEARPRGSECIQRRCTLGSLRFLQLGSHYAYNKPHLQFPVSPSAALNQGLHYYRRRMRLIPEKGSLYLTGSRYGLPARLHQVARLHAPVPDGVTFFAFSTQGDHGPLTLLLPCAELLRSYHQALLARFRGVSCDATFRDNEADSIQRFALEHVLAPALVHGERGRPRPLLFRPPYGGNLVIAGQGYRLADKQGEVVFITSHLLIESQLTVDLRERYSKSWKHSMGHLATFAPAFSNTHVMLHDIGATARHGCSATTRNYDVRSFKAQLRYFDKTLATMVAVKGPETEIHDLANWKDDGYHSIPTHSLTVSTSFLQAPTRSGPPSRPNARRQRRRPTRDAS